MVKASYKIHVPNYSLHGKPLGDLLGIHDFESVEQAIIYLHDKLMFKTVKEAIDWGYKISKK